jgi:hypothetical protein
MDFINLKDDFQSEWIVDIDLPHRSSFDIFLELLYVLGWFFFIIYTYSRLFAVPPYVHPMVGASHGITFEEFQEADLMISKRKENVEKFQIIDN